MPSKILFTYCIKQPFKTKAQNITGMNIGVMEQFFAKIFIILY